MDNSIDYTRALSAQTEPMLVAGGILLLSVIIVMIIVIKKRWNGKFMPLLLGVIAYMIFVFIFANLITSLFSMIPSVDRAFTYNQNAYMILYTGLAAVGYLIARIIISNMLIGRYETKGDVYMAGIGLGIGDAVLYGITIVSYYVWCIAINSEGGLAAALSGMEAAEALSTYESIEMLFSAPPVLWLLIGASTVMDFFINFSLTNVTFGVVKGQLSNNWHIISTLIYFAAAISFQVYNSTSVVSIAVMFAIKLVIFAAAMYYTFKVAAGEIEYVE